MQKRREPGRPSLTRRPECHRLSPARQGVVMGELLGPLGAKTAQVTRWLLVRSKGSGFAGLRRFCAY